MIPVDVLDILFIIYLSRVCGDDPSRQGDDGLAKSFVPRMRG